MLLLPTIAEVNFIDPWAPVPPFASHVGVKVTVKEEPASGNVLFARLLQGVTPLAAPTEAAAGAKVVTVEPAAPLAAALPYTVQVQWAPVQKAPTEWVDPTKVVTAPVVTAPARLLGGEVTATGIALRWESGAGGGEARVFDRSPQPVGRVVVGPVAGGGGTASSTWNAGSTYGVYLRSVQPVKAKSGFSEPFSLGPATPPIPVPTAAPALSAVVYDGENLTVDWQPVTLPTGLVVGDLDYALHVLSGAGGGELSRASAGERGGRIPFQVAGAGPIQVAGSVRFDAIPGPVGTGQPILTAKPVLTTLTVAPGSVTATFSPPSGQPGKPQVTAELLEDGAVVDTKSGAEATPTVRFERKLTSGRRYELQARFEDPQGPPKLTGPTGPRLPVLGPAPVITGVSYDGTRLVVAWKEGPLHGVEGYIVKLSPVAGAAIEFRTGPQSRLEADVFLNLGTTWGVTVQPYGAGLVGLASAPHLLTLPPVAAPVLRKVAYDGEALTVEWDSATLPALSGYQVVLAGGLSQTVSLGRENSLTLPLPAAKAAGTTVTVTGISETRKTPASATVAVVTAVPAITAVTIKTNIKAAWSVTGPPAGATYVGELLDDLAVLEAVAATAAEATFALPARRGRYSVRGHVEVGVSRGPDSAAVAVLPQGTTVSFAALLDDVLTMEWAPVSGATGYRVTYGSGTQKTVETGATRLVLPVDVGALAPSTLWVAPVGPRTTGPSTGISVVAGYAIDSGAYDGGTLSVTLGGTLEPTPETLWVDVLVEGAVAARARREGAPADAISIPVALPPGTAAAVRVTGVGKGPVTPPSLAVPVPTRAPHGVSAVYDGKNLHVAWEPVAEAGVGGYRVTVSGTSTPVEPRIVSGRDAAGVTIAAAFASPLPQGAAVTVSAVSAAGPGKHLAGPASAAATPTLAGFARAVTAPAEKQPPYLYRLGEYQGLEAISGEDVVAYLPSPFPPPEANVLPPRIEPEGENKYFSLTSTGTGLPYELRIDKAIWASFGQDAVRADIRDAYRAFLKAVEAQSAAPWGIPLVRQAIAAVMPQTFAETLYYRYGLWRWEGGAKNPESLRTVDLEPGLRLRLSGALWQAVTGEKDPLNGYVAVGEETYELGATVPPKSGAPGIEASARSLSANAFLSLLYPGGAGQSAAQGPAAGPLDFFGNNRQTYYRLFYPAEIRGSGESGSSLITDNVAIVGAPTWTRLEEVTDQFAKHGFQPPAPGGSIFAGYFRGRAALTPLLSASVDGESSWVPVGTTVRQLLASAGQPIWPAGGDAVRLRRVTAGVGDRPFEAPALRREPVDLDAAAVSGDPPLWPLDLPLLGGDEIAAAGGGA